MPTLKAHYVLSCLDTCKILETDNLPKLRRRFEKWWSIEEDQPMALIDLHAELLIRGLRPDPRP